MAGMWLTRRASAELSIFPDPRLAACRATGCPALCGARTLILVTCGGLVIPRQVMRCLSKTAVLCLSTSSDVERMSPEILRCAQNDTAIKRLYRSW